MPRPYQLGQRQAAINETRARILTAARQVLMDSDGFATFSMDAVARAANVARMTVYYQFESKVGLLEALSDDLATRGGMEQLSTAFGQPDPLAALADYIAVFGRFWTTDRPVMRRLRGLAMLDTEFAQVIQSRDERRRMGLSVIVRRLAATSNQLLSASADELVDILHMLTSFESFDTLAGVTRSPTDVVPIVQRLARAALGLDNV